MMKYLKGFVVAALTLTAIMHLLFRPSNNRNWSQDQQVLPQIQREGSVFSIKNIRNFKYRSITEYSPHYYDSKFDINELKQVYFLVEPFSGFGGAAHTFLSFEFEGPRFLAISVEIRKEKGESFSPLKGVLRQYEIMYVIADERDVIKLRANFRKDKVFLYPVQADLERKKALFVDMLERAKELEEHPEFYNTILNNCTTNIARHVNKIAQGRIPWDLTWLLPEDSDAFAFKLGLISNEMSFEQTRQRALINDRSLLYGDHNDYSLKIRERY